MCKNPARSLPGKVAGENVDRASRLIGHVHKKTLRRTCIIACTMVASFKGPAQREQADNIDVALRQ